MASRTEYIGRQSAASLRPGDIIWDSQLRRFGARCRPRATTYFIKVRIDGRQRWFTLGKHGPLTANEARSKAKQMLADIDGGRDPTREQETPSYRRGRLKRRERSPILHGDLSNPIVLPDGLVVGVLRERVLGRPLSAAEHQALDIQSIAQPKSARMRLLAERLGADITSLNGWLEVALWLAEEFVEGLQVVTAGEARRARGGAPGGHQAGHEDLPELVRMVEFGLLGKRSNTHARGSAASTDERGSGPTRLGAHTIKREKNRRSGKPICVLGTSLQKPLRQSRP